MQILFASSEVAPFAKTGGLADVAGALPKALKTLGHDIRVVLPKYRSVMLLSTDCSASCPDSPFRSPAPSRPRVWEGRSDRPRLLHQQDDYYDRQGLYQVEGRDHPDNAERFAFFSRALLELTRAVASHRPYTIAMTGRPPGPDLPPEYVSERPRVSGRRRPLTVHNLGTRVCFKPATLAVANLVRSCHSVGIEFYKRSTS